MNTMLSTYSFSPAQQRLWRLMQKANNFYAQCTIQINDDLNINELLIAIQHVVDRHEILRTKYPSEFDAIPVATVFSKGDFLYTFHDFSQSGFDVQISELTKVVDPEPFELLNDQKALPVVVKVVCMSAYRYILIVRASALAVDNYSLMNIVSEICYNYDSKKSSNTEVVQYSIFNNWMNTLANSPVEEASWFWDNYDFRKYQRLILPCENKNVISNEYIFNNTSVILDNLTSNQIDGLSKNEQVSISSIAIAALSALLSHKIDANEIVIASIENKRAYNELESAVGLITKTLPIVINLKHGLNFIDLARQIEDTRNDVVGWGDYLSGYDKEITYAEEGFCDVAVEYLDLCNLFAGTNKNLFNFIKFQGNTDNFKLKLFLTRYHDVFELSFYYNADWFTDAEIEVLKKQVVVLLNGAVKNPDHSFNTITIADEKEVDLILKIFNRGPSSVSSANYSIIDAFYKQVEKHPSLPAVEFEGGVLNYKQLDIESNRLANYLISSYDVRPKDKIALMLDRSEKMIISLLAILKTGASYLPIDSSIPLERKWRLIKDSGVQTLIAGSAHMFDFPDYTGKFFAYNIQFDDIEASIDRPAIKIQSQDIAYIIYTSGSTGKPKGVQIPHSSLMNYVNWFLATYQINERDSSLLFSSIAFDLSYTNLWSTLVSGGQLILHKEDKYFNPEILLKELVDKQVTFVKLTPSHFKMIVMATNFKTVAKQLNLRLIVLGGEELNAADIEQYFSYQPDVKFVNHYGPTETTIGTIAEDIELSSWETFKLKPVIGHPICGNSIYILNQDNSLAAIGVAGEIAVSGPGLSLGYLNNPELTSKKIIDNPFTLNSKLYLTGDSGRWLADGRIEFLGRKDDQVKIRGYRIELGEIDTVLNQHPLINEAVTFASKNQQGDKEIKSYIVCNESIKADELKIYLSGKLPEYMIPSQITEVGEMPLTLNGKIDTQTLLAVKEQDERQYQEPINKIQTELVKIWQEVLEKRIGIRDDFFAFGGHSLKAVQIVSRIYKELNVKVELRDIFESSTIEELSIIIEQSEKVVFEGITPIGKQEYYDVSAAQKRLWILDQMEESKIAYNRPASYVFEGVFNKDALSQSFSILLKRHESLRTTFATVNGDLKQVINDESCFDDKLNYLDLRHESDRLKIAQNIAHAENFKAFDLEKGPLFRTQLLQLEDDLHVFLFNIHHIISDGWSIKVIVQEILSLYNGISKGLTPSLPDLKIQYKDYAAWQNQQLSGEKLKEHQEYWLNIFDGEIPVLNMPLDYSRPLVKTYNGAINGIVLSKELTKGLNELSNYYGASLFMTLISSLTTLLYRYTGQEDIIIGSPVAGRDHRDLENQIGFYVNTLALRMKFDGEESFEVLLNKVKETTLNSYKHQIYPYDRLVDDLNLTRDRSRTPLFDVNLVLQNIDIGNQVLQERISDIENVNTKGFNTGYYTSKYDLLFHCNEEDNHISIYVEYNTDLFKKSSIQRLLSNFNKLLQSTVKNSKIKLNSYDFISENEKDLLLNNFNDTLWNIEPGENVIDMFSRQVELNPDKPAIIRDDITLTYNELNKRVNQIADFLVTDQHDANPLIAILLDNSINSVVAILSVLKAGKTYLPVDPGYPYDRIKYILNDARVTGILSEKKYIKSINKLQWECPGLGMYLCLDSANPILEEEELNELMKEELWDYVGSNNNTDIDVGGWVSSYTGEALSDKEMEEYSENVFLKLQPYITKQSRVLEIGCSSGISMFRIAPFVKEYYGTDLSGKILEYTSNEVVNRGFNNIKLHHLPAHQIDQVGGGFDIVVINSVVQSFNGYNYVRNVLKSVVNLMNDGGVLFLGDLQDLELKDGLIKSLSDFKNQNPDKSYRTKIDWSNELFIPKQFINDLIYEIDGIESVSHSEKIASIQNELTQFRYDSVLRINKNNLVHKNKLEKSKKQFGTSSLLACSEYNKSHEISNSDNAYIIYTSGSTGNPKGVGVSHKSFSNYVSWANNAYFNNEAEGNMALITSLAFDLTLTSIFCPLTRGKKLFIYTQSDINKSLTECFLNLEVDTIKLTPSHVNLANHLPVLYTGLKQIIMGGEELKIQHVNIIKSFSPDIKIYNEYGPTENTVGCTMAEVSEEYLGIGKPVANTKVYILDLNLTLLPLGAVGEICTSGVCLANGYINNDKLSKIKFIKNPFNKSERLYLTGDLGRWKDNGTLELAGRKDNQVKIRGYRVEIGEIEKIIADFNNIADCKVIVRNDEEKQLVAYFTHTQPINISDLRKYTKEILPLYMVPEFFVPLNEIPLTTNGKINFELLPNPEGVEVAINSNYVPPSNTTERELVAIWEEILKRDNIGIKDDFFDLGGHSLKATQVISRVYKKLNKSVTLSNIFSFPTIESLALLISDLNAVKYEKIQAMPLQEYYDVSHAQRRLWILDQLEVSSTAYNMPGSLVFHGDLDIEKLSGAFEELIDRHESLRTSFISINDELKQRINSKESTGFKLEYLDLRNRLELEDLTRSIAVNTLKESFDLEKGPLLRVKLLHLEKSKYVFLLSMHHIVSDGWSMDILINEILTIYNARFNNLPNPLIPLTIHYKDYVHWQNNILKDGQVEKDQQYWINKFKGVLPQLNIPTDYSRPANKTYNGAAVPFVIDGIQTKGLNELNQESGTTLFMALVSFIKILLSQYSGQDDIVIGFPVAGREHQDLENQIGLYLNTLPLKTNIDGTMSLQELLAQVKDNTLEAYTHQLYPLDKLVEDLNIKIDRSRSPLFDVMVVLQNINVIQAEQSEGLEGVYVEGYTTNWTPSKFDLSFYFSEIDGHIQSKIVYNTDLFKRERIELMILEFTELIANGLLNKNQPISEINFSIEHKDESEYPKIDFNF